mgnify:FL=1
MSKTEKNKHIINVMNERIEKRGYKGKLEFDPIPNTFKRRNNFTTKADGTGVFTGFLWQMNNLSDAELLTDIDGRINEAVRHFKL